MSKTLDDLLADFDAAVLRAQAANREEMTPWAFTRAGIIAVLTALREEIVREFERCDSCSGIEHVKPFFDEILALSEGGQAAGVPASNGGTELDRTSGPAPAAPAPVCEWTDVGKGWDTGCGGWDTSWSSAGGKIICPICKAPIKFTEGKQ